ncbi:MAG: hypothetical protein ACI9MR_005160 [Myxococcota bacterium]|jgi:hypothetical protein
MASQKSILDIAGVIPAVKCSMCDTLYAADSDAFVTFYGSVTVGLETVLVGVDPPKKPAKRAVSVVCRDPRCVAGLVRGMLGCPEDETGDNERLWAQALKVWALASGHQLKESPKTEAAPPPAKRVRRRA